MAKRMKDEKEKVHNKKEEMAEKNGKSMMKFMKSKSKKKK